MHAIVRPNRIDILGASALSKDAWDPMLDELKAMHVPSLTPVGKRMSASVSPSGRMDAFIYRTSSMPDAEVVRILGKYGIQANVSSEEVETDEEVVTLHLGDVVEEIATKRLGKIDNMSIEHHACGQQTVHYWRVFFEDGKQPLLGIIKDASELRLVSCPHSETQPGFKPARSII